MPRTPLDHPFATPPGPDAAIEVAPGIHWLRLPLPFALDHVNVWLLKDGDGWVVVDTGVDDPATRAAWENALAGKRVTRLICTHFHPDHMGLAGWLGERHGVALTATLGEWSFGRMLTLEVGPDYADNQIEHYRRAGFGPDLLEGVRGRVGSYRGRVSPLPPFINTIKDGSRLSIDGRDWRVVVGQGHAPEHACLWCPDAGVLISGDQILPRISPIVGVWPQQPDDDPLGDFLASLDMLKTLPADTLVLPSHGLPFRGLHLRADELLHHHAQRLDRLRAAATPATALELSRALFRRELDAQQMGFAAGETLSHANHLVELREWRRDCRDDGVWLFGPA
ncbi:MAG TPA: MBL fold metallo-hydrolase [Magnetospirillum sp.]|nr:MBL fold metallo-hydrolase [Magnetospirillum sp.]